jgi:hypothetical protein
VTEASHLPTFAFCLLPHAFCLLPSSFSVPVPTFQAAPLPLVLDFGIVLRTYPWPCSHVPRR